MENTSDWEAALPGELSGKWGEDLLSVAESQLDYTESSRNYLVAEDGETLRGYNRYGAWYGSYTQDANQPYRDWNVTFLFFCIYYSGIADFPLEETCPEWIDSLDYYGLYRAAGEYVPNPGDLVFVDTDGDGEADRAGVVSKAEEDKLTVVEGDVEGAVAEVSYDLSETAADTESEEPTPEIIGYADMGEAQTGAQQETGDVSLLKTLTGGDYLYLDPGVWNVDGAKYAIYFQNGTWSGFFEHVEGNIWKVKLPNNWNSSVGIIFSRQNSSSTTPSWSNNWNQEPGQNQGYYYVQSDRNLFRITGWNSAGSWDQEWYSEYGEMTDAPGSGKRFVYYDATLSKLNFVSNDTSYYGSSIPIPNGNMYCYYWYGGSAAGEIVEMVRMSPYTSGGHSWSNVYRAEIPASATDVIFFSNTSKTWPNDSQKPQQTEDLKIPTNVSNPCFYGDPSDDVIYNNAKRSGYWGEAFRVRDAEAGKGSDVVDISSGTFTKQNNVLYVNTTLYDYYSDYELSGNNRDYYPLESTQGTINSHRIYQSFRHLNQALSTFYYENRSEHQLYWGNFQHDRYTTNAFSQIYQTLQLYGYAENKNKFFYENNSMSDWNGNELSNANNAAQGLVDSTLGQNNALMIGGLSAPFFNESFLSGNNDLNTKLAEVYHNVQFPFVKKALSSSAGGTVDYWYFDSADETAANRYLQLKQDGGSYYLASSSNPINAQKTDGSAVLGYLPFNTSAQSGKAAQLNYGFGQVFEINFRLTEDGTVTTTEGNKAPIEFNFSGDDDVWVFIDGQLVLDIGGDHGIVTGSINFKDRKATVSSVKTTSGGVETNKVTAFPAALNTNDFYASAHTLTMFYMERGLWESNMKITFNFPDESLLEVEKQVNDSAVNSIFGDLFQDQDLFTFNIKTLATHYGTVAVDTGDEAQKVIAASAGYLSAQSGITLNIGSVGGGQGVHWYTDQDDSGIANRSTRYGQIAVSEPFALGDYQYLDFEFYYDEDTTDTPNLANVFIDLVDAGGNTLLTDDYMSVSKGVTGSIAMKTRQWISVRLDLNKMVRDSATPMSAIRFGYDYGRNIYIQGITFHPTTVLNTTTVGFVMPQAEIPDYGTAQSGALAVPVGAVYTSSDGTAYRIGSNGQFTLCDGESIIFHDQFRRGSYIYLEEQYSYLYSTSWSMYEGRNETLVDNSEVPNGDSTVTGGGQNMTNVSGGIVTDGRVEKIGRLTDEATGVNRYQTTGTAAAPGNTFVFRHYADPDNTTETTKLKIVYTNTIKTGSMTFGKARASGSEAFDENQDFTFYVEFYNVGGMNLESSPIIAGPYTLKVGEKETITGIPLGTWFVIHEVKPADDSIVLENVGFDLGEYGKGYMVPKNGTVNGKATYAVDGLIPTTGSSDVSYTFNNSKKSVVNLTVKKVWDTDDAVSVPNAISVQLQRSTDGTKWDKVSGYEKVALNRGYTSWGDYSYTFYDLDRYTDKNKTAEYQYRVVELDSSGVPAESGTITLGGNEYTVTSEVTSTETGSAKVYSQTITNTLVPKVQVTVTKAWDVPDGTTLPGSVTVQLQRSTDGDTWTVVPDYTNITLRTAENWTYTFSDLDVKDASGNRYKYRVVELNSGNVIGDGGTFTAGDKEYKVTYGSVTSTSGTVYSQTITNTLVPKVQVTVNKVWNDLDNAAKPESITVWLQRSENGSDWQPVSSCELTDNNWSHTFANLDKYVNFAAAAKVEWQYRVVEVVDGNVIGEGSTFTANNVEYKVTYGEAISTGDDAYTQTITNTAVPKVTLYLYKRDATNTEKLLSDVTFLLEKTGDTGFETVSQTTSNNGAVTFTGLKPGTYTLTETKTADGYALLGAPITIVIEEHTGAGGEITYTALIDGESAKSFDLNADTYTLTMTIYNRKNLEMPATGGTFGFEFWLLAGLLITALPLVMYAFSCYIKGGKYLRK